MPLQHVPKEGPPVCLHIMVTGSLEEMLHERLATVTLSLITLTRGPVGHLVSSHAREIKYANKTSSLNSVAMVKLTFSSNCRLSRCRCS